MDFSEQAKKLGNSLIGNVSKANLRVKKAHQGGEATGSITSLANPGSLGTNLGDSVTAASLMNESSEYVNLTVQFNPSSLRFDSVAGEQVNMSGGNMGAGGANQIVQYTSPVATTLSVQLIFDDVNVYDAFMMQNMNMTAGNAFTGASDAVKTAKYGDSAYTVAPWIDGLVALLTDPLTRMAVFTWGEIQFAGEITRVDARYSMFNKKGEPIRGTVDLSIRQGDTKALGFDPAYQKKAFDKVFGEAGADFAGGGAGWRQYTNNNLLNLNL